MIGCQKASHLVRTTESLAAASWCPSFRTTVVRVDHRRRRLRHLRRSKIFRQWENIVRKNTDRGGFKNQLFSVLEFNYFNIFAQVELSCKLRKCFDFKQRQRSHLGTILFQLFEIWELDPNTDTFGRKLNCYSNLQFF